MWMAIDRRGSILVADTGNGRLQKLSPSGAPIFCVGGGKDRQLYGPQGVEVDAVGNCYIADTFSHCVVKFDANGREVARFGCRGASVGEFEEPQDLALDQEGRLYVIEMANNRLQVFDSENRSTACFEGSTRAIGRLNGPTGVAIGPSGEIYVSDTVNHRVLRMIWH
jgi:DNA-binding beta-propeller fold protein YncE